jgi:uncharacterized protein involved in response to NO
MTMSRQHVDGVRRISPPALLGYGFRPFFLLAALAAIAIVPTWLFALAGGDWPAGALPPQSWHAHEMLFGFVGAAVAGFMLTAIPNWTGAVPVTGWPLGLLAGLWMAGRIALCPDIAMSRPWAATIDLAFYPALAVTVGLPLVRAGKWRNSAFLAMLALLWVANLLFHLEWLGAASGTVAVGIRLAVDIMLLMVVVIGGRIVPNFTLGALRRSDPTIAIIPLPLLETMAIAVVVLIGVIDLVTPESALAGVAAAIAAILHGLRLARWRGLQTCRQPILWILHLGYAWLVVGLALKASWILIGANFASAWMHALTVGSFSTMILAVMSRASLGHTGRPVVAAWPTVLAYVALILAAALRIAAPLFGGAYPSIVGIAGGLWIIAFAAFVAVYAPILVRARRDGSPG